MVAIDKFVANAEAAIADIHDGAVVMVGGFGDAGSPTELLHALADRKLRDLTVINNNAGTGEVGLARLLQVGSVSKVICSFPRSIMPEIFEAGYRSGANQAGNRPARHASGTDSCRRRRYWGVLYANLGGHHAGRG